MSRIRIANPKPGSAKYATVGQANRYVHRGEAVLIGNELTFLSAAEQKHMNYIERHLIQAGRAFSDVYIKGPVNWRGDGLTEKFYLPGIRVS